MYDRHIQTNHEIQGQNQDNSLVKSSWAKKGASSGQTNPQSKLTRTTSKFMSDFLPPQEDDPDDDDIKKVEIMHLHDQILVEHHLNKGKSGSAFADEHRTEIEYKIKFIFAMIRQRNGYLQKLFGRKFSYVQNHLSNKVINAIVNKVMNVLQWNVEEEFNLIFKYLQSIFFTQEMAGCFFESYLLFDNLYDLFVFKSSERDITLNFGLQKY